MNDSTLLRSALRAVLAGLLAVAAGAAAAQADARRPAAPAPTAAVTAAPGAYWAAGPTLLERQNVDTRDLRGNVVMVFYWSTGCSLCLQKMGELRASANGLRGKPFQLVLVNLDRSSADVEGYVRTVKVMDPRGPAMPVLWAGDPAFSHSLAGPPARLPLTLLIDTRGEVVQRHEGRIAPEAWNAVPGLLPKGGARP